MAKLNLEKIVQIGELYDDASNIAKSFSSDVSNYKTINEYVMKYMGGRTEEEKKRIYGEMKKASPAMVRESMDTNTKNIEGELVKSVSESYADLVNSENPQILETIALAISGLGEKLSKVEEAVRKGDVKAIQEIYASQYKGDPVMEHFAYRIAGKEFYLGIYPEVLEMEKGKLLSPFINTKTENGKEINYLDTAKLKPYLLSEMEKLEDKDKNKAYLRVGKEIFGLAKQAKEQEEKAKKKEAKNKKKK